MPGDIGEPRWLSAEQIDRLNELIVERTGENHLVLSWSLLEGAAARPINQWGYEVTSDLIVLAVRLLEAIGKNHCFQQGNKRTAFHAATAFLELNGVVLDLPDVDTNARIVEGVIVGDISADVLVSVFRAAVRTTADPPEG